jgi:hypothetical protein
MECYIVFFITYAGALSAVFSGFVTGGAASLGIPIAIGQFYMFLLREKLYLS